MARCPFFVKGKQRRRLEGTHGERRPERIGSGNVRTAEAMIRQVGDARTHQAQERIGGEMLASLRGHDGPGNPRLEHLNSLQGEGHGRMNVDEKATGISRWLLGFIVLRELLQPVQRFQIANRLDSLIPRYNIAPGQMVPVVISQSPNRVVLMRWGLIPHWAKDQKTPYKMINARIETLTQRPSYRGLLAAHRCLIPASGYYEWKAEGREKIPYYIHPAAGAFVAFAGLYDTWKDMTGEEIQTFTIVTREADDQMARLHNRMSVMLAREDEQAWLAPQLTIPSQAVEIVPASRLTPIRSREW